MGVASNRVDVHQLVRGRRARARAPRRAAQHAVPPTRRHPHALLQHRVAQPGAQQRPRLVVRLQPRRGRRSGARALPGGPPHRRGARRRRAGPPRRRGRCTRRVRTSSVNATAGARGGAGGVPSSRRPVRAHLRALDDDTVCTRPRLSARSPASGIDTVVTGTKIRWVVEMMRGPELAGARIARGRASPPDPTAIVEYTFHDAGPGEAAIDLEATARRAARARRRAAPPSRSASAGRRSARSSPRVGDVPAFGWRTFVPVAVERRQRPVTTAR